MSSEEDAVASIARNVPTETDGFERQATRFINR
jgi:hypothetical protein